MARTDGLQCVYKQIHDKEASPLQEPHTSCAIHLGSCNRTCSSQSSEGGLHGPKWMRMKESHIRKANRVPPSWFTKAGCRPPRFQEAICAIYYILRMQIIS